MGDVRSYTHMCSELVTLVYDNGAADPKAIVGNLEEIGEWAACVLADDPVTPGSRVAILCQSHHLHGVVECCTIDDLLGFVMRIGLDADSRWSEARFRPKHLYHILQNDEGKRPVVAA